MAAPDFHLLPENEVPDGPPCFVPARAIVAGTSDGALFTHRPWKVTIYNTGTVDLVWGVSKVAVEASHGAPLGVGESYTLEGHGDLPLPLVRLVVYCPGAVNGEWALTVHYSRQPINAGMPELTVAEWFPQFDASDPDNIAPGVSA